MANKYAFWKYDRFPFVVGSEVTNILTNTDNGIHVTSKSYGRISLSGENNYEFLEVEDGEHIKKQLTVMEAEYRARQKALLEEFKQKALSVAPFLNKFSPYKDN